MKASEAAEPHEPRKGVLDEALAQAGHSRLVAMLCGRIRDHNGRDVRLTLTCQAHPGEPLAFCGPDGPSPWRVEILATRDDP
ncbi:hypothetical protein Psi01_82730 [Planobispora siamensis]|uniref:Uncharacterized protein n=1 Tax=Planobispora siamensis TaxID=936338 RepID=A0A8J3SNE5_9ACTN|nr:hypothetical protein Psi01_82730 [Planobispora siamensis]